MGSKSTGLRTFLWQQKQVKLIIISHILQEHVLHDELIKASGLESTILRKRREESTQLLSRGYTNMIVFAGGEGPSEWSVLLALTWISLFKTSTPKCLSVSETFKTLVQKFITSIINQAHGHISKYNTYFYSDNNTVEIKASVRCVAPHMELEAKFVHWIDLAPMLQPRIGHGLVEAGTI